MVSSYTNNTVGLSINVQCIRSSVSCYKCMGSFSNVEYCSENTYNDKTFVMSFDVGK